MNLSPETMGVSGAEAQGKWFISSYPPSYSRRSKATGTLLASGRSDRTEKPLLTARTGYNTLHHENEEEAANSDDKIVMSNADSASDSQISNNTLHISRSTLDAIMVNEFQTMDFSITFAAKKRRMNVEGYF